MMKTFMKQLLLLAMIFVTINATGSNVPQQQQNSGITQEYRTAVRSLLNVTGFGNTMRDNLTATYAQMGLQGQYVDDIVNELVEKMPEKMVDIYAKYFTLDEIKQLMEVNSNEVQVKVRSMQAQCTKDLMQEGQYYALGKESPSAGIVVPEDFDKAMREFLEVSDFSKQMEKLQSIFLQNLGSQSSVGGFNDMLPDIMVRVYSKYFTIADIKQLTDLAKMPIMKKFSEKTPAITQDTMSVTQEIMMDYFKDLF